MKKYFITATDTDAGKTQIAQSLVYALTQQGKKVAVYKPISAGCEWRDGQLINQDAELLMMQSNCDQAITQINPIAFEEPIAPHIAADKHNKAIDVGQIKSVYQTICQLSPDVVITEGAGGWRLPLGNGHFLSEFAQQSKQDVILVVNMKLGCLNHALLTYQAILHDGLNCAGWVANCPDEMPYLSDNIEELASLIQAPFLGKVPYEQEIKKVAMLLDTSPL
ncbi:dethiobiotin synthase [Thalassotalea sp. G2M2-11]|uniref:dethiobiotin synthase n=1 Tax=Thalassotalea sp. G2M2-11 TaxID=2787627 RepID=UPI0019D29712|nr:dethiobiotin synthase [Thalassotalea sp. G2M2-11]